MEIAQIIFISAIPVQEFLTDIVSDMLLELEVCIYEAIQLFSHNRLSGLKLPISEIVPFTADAIGNLLVAIKELSDLLLNMELIQKEALDNFKLFGHLPE